MDINCLNQFTNESCAIYNGDSFEIIKTIPKQSVGLSVFSPPFVDLYCYSDNERDMGNNRGYDAFFAQFGFLAEELRRITMPGRLVLVHCIDIPAMKERDGYIGLKDFPGDIIRLFQKHGFVYHSRFTIWKDPLIEATRTKAIGLMHKQLCKDSSRSVRAGLPDYLLAFRAPGENLHPIKHPNGLEKYFGKTDPGGSGVKRSHNIWRAYASPIWSDIRQTRTLNKSGARSENDEKHICPLQLDVIERCITLYSNPGEIVFTPFMGIGSEVFGAICLGRKGIGIELNHRFYSQAVKNVQLATTANAGDDLLFSDETPEDED